MARVRSPNYPTFGLPEAIKLVTVIQAKEQHLAAPKEVVAKHLGYSSLHGLASRVVSAIEKYGLLEEVNGDKVKVSALAVSILFSATPEEKQKAINEAAYKPPLFAAINEEWQGQRPSDANLRVYLIRRKFSSDVLDRVIEIYHETMDLVTPDSGGYSANEAAPKGAEPQEKSIMQPAAHRQTPSTSEPFRVSFTGDGIEVTGRLTSSERADELIRAITALKPLLEPVAGPMATGYTDDEEGRQAEERDRKRDEEL